MNKLDERKVQAAYRVHGSLRRAGDALGVSYQTVRRILKDGGVPLKPPGGSSLKGKRMTKKHRGCLPNWLRSHPDVRLPRSPSQISQVTGCSLDAVKSYLYRRRKIDGRLS